MAPVSSGIRLVDRYLLCDQIGFGGMATIHLARLLGPEGFSRTVVVKQLHPQFAQDPLFVAMFLDEARLAVRIRHGNVVSPLDIVATGTELFIVMDYVNGESLAALLREVNGPLDPAIASAIVVHVLLGLHAAHEATSERGESLGIVHRDVSPQNILVGQDGVARVLDFGIAKAAARSQTTEEGKLKGKIGYMAPEQLRLEAVDRRADLFTTGIVLWEALTGCALFAADALGASVELILRGEIAPPSSLNPAVGPEVDAFVMTSLEREPERRFQDALSMAQALQRAAPPASVLEVMRWVESLAGPELQRKRELVRRAETVTLEDVGLPNRAQDPPPAPLEKREATPATMAAAFSQVTLTAVSARVVAEGARAATDDVAGRTERLDQVTPATAEAPDAGAKAESAALPVTAPRSAKPRLVTYALAGAGAIAITVGVLAAVIPRATESSEAPATAAGSIWIQGARPRAPAEAAPEDPALPASGGSAAPAVAAAPIAASAVEAATSAPSASVIPRSEVTSATGSRPATGRSVVSSPAVRAPGPATVPNPATTAAVRDASATRAKAANCNPPWTINAQNIKVFKVECLR